MTMESKSPDPELPQTILIVGGGTAGWMTAAALAHLLPANHWRIALVESDSIGTVGVGEATIPQILHFNRALGIDERELMAATHGTFKLGIAFEGWRAPGHRYCHAFGQIGRDLGLLPFYQYWLAGRADDETCLDAYSVAAQAAYAGKFAHPDPQRPAPAGGHAYALQFDASAYAAFLRVRAEAGGVVRHEGTIARVQRDPATGDVAQVELADGRTLAADLFIDCSGFRALLMEETLQTGFEDWSHWLPCDRAWAVPCTLMGAPAPYTRSIAQPAGWQWQIPLTHRVGNGHVYCSGYISDQDAADLLLANLPGEALAEPRLLRFTAGRRKAVWAHNVVAIGLSSGFLEPLESTSIHLIQTGIERLLQRLPADRAPADCPTRAAYNADAALEMERIRDFIILHYAQNGRDEAFWQDRRSMPLPDSLSARIALFAETGHIEQRERDLFTPLAWQQVMLGQGIVPKNRHPLVKQLTDDQLADFLATVRRSVAASAAAMPAHGAMLPHVTHAPQGEAA